MTYSVEIVIITDHAYTAQSTTTGIVCRLLDQFAVVVITPRIENQSLASYIEGFVLGMNEELGKIPDMKLNDRVLRGLEGMIADEVLRAE